MHILAAAAKLAALRMRGTSRGANERCSSFSLKPACGFLVSCVLRWISFDGKYFRNAKQKGKRRDVVYVSPEARASLKDYFDNERRRESGLIFQSRNGKPMLRKDADQYLKQIRAMANTNVPVHDRVNLNAHLMRLTVLEQVEQKLGRAFD
jgi:integrase